MQQVNPLKILGSLRGDAPQWGEGGKPLVTAKRADQPSVEGWREVRREEGNASQCMVPFLSLRISPPPRLLHAVLRLASVR